MKHITSFFNLLANLGVKPNTSHLSQKEIILSNKISILLIPFVILGIIMSFQSEVYFTTVGFWLFLVFLICVFPLNKNDKSLITRFGLSVLPQLFLLFPNVISGLGKAENYLTFSFAFIGFAIVPLLLFQERKNNGILILALLVNLLVVLFFDALMVWSDKNEIDFRLIENNYIYYKLPQIILWALMVGAFQYLKKESTNYAERLETANFSLKEYNNEIQLRNREILDQNELLNEKQKKIELQAIKLENNNNELKNTKLELLNTIDKLKLAKERLDQKEAEAKSILNALNEHYLVAQYDLDGNLVNINTKVIELLGVLQNEYFKNIKPIFNQKNNHENNSYNGHSFNKIWHDVLNGKAHTIDLEYPVGDDVKYLATTLAPLFDRNNKPYRILAIGQDITELVEKNEKIDKINEELKEKIFEISQQNELLNFQQREIFDKSEELHRQKQVIEEINESLEIRVQERTSVLEEKNKQLAEYAFINSHVLRSPVSTMIGLINLMSYADLPENERKVYEYLKDTAKILDKVVYKINSAINNGFHFDRAYLEPERNFHPMKKQ